jgi:hypothetical protein
MVQTPDKKGLVTTQTFSGKGVVIRIYPNTLTMTVQGAGCKEWINTFLKGCKSKLVTQEYSNKIPKNIARTSLNN